MSGQQIAIDFFEQHGPVDPALGLFHPIIQQWFAQTLGEPSQPQRQGWPVIRAHEDVLIAAPTGSGKTLTAFLAALDDLFRKAVDGALPDHTQVVYVSPLKALSNDVQKNLLQPLGQIRERALAAGLNPQDIRVQVRTGDTSASERSSMAKKPPHVLITTPESLYLVLTSPRSRETLRNVRTVIVDEIHALARDKRGSHLALSLERLCALTTARPQRVGLSATQKPLERIAAFLTGREQGTKLVQVGHLRPWDLRVEIPEDELGAAATHEMWGQVYDRIELLAQQHRTIIVFTNTRKMSERIAHDMGERIGQELVSAHHGSMSRELRLAAEERLKSGALRIMVATASLELGIDVGSIDLVVQVGSPRSIAVLLQRVGRAGHHKAGISKGVLFAMTRDELAECVALLRAVREGALDAVRIPEKPLDILAQQIVAACACEEWDERDLFDLVRNAHPYRDLTEAEYEQVLKMLAEGVATSRGRARVHLHRDRVNRRLKARPGARLAALMNGGAIAETFQYPVIAEPEGKQVGTLDEDFAVESTAGDVFLLGSTSWRIQSVRGGAVRVEDAKGQPPSVPFWLGEAPARTAELSAEVAKLREDLLRMPDPKGYLESELRVPEVAAELLVRYLQASCAVLGAMPSHSTVVAERFFDEAGGMQLVIHAPFGGRINRAWGMALRKRFCRSFDFELQAAANDDALLLSLGEQHSFPLAEIFDFLSAESVEDVLTQAVLQAPIFGTRFRWNASRALALSRFQMGKKVPPQIQRARSEDLLAAVFPAQVGCQDNHGGGDIELPDHPLVKETMDNCLREAMDIDGLKDVLRGIRTGKIRTVAADVPEPSPLSHHILNSAPYTYLDDAPLEERRARAVQLRRTLPAEDAKAFGALDGAAIAQVVADARPPMRDADELHDALLALVLVSDEEADPSQLAQLSETGRAAWWVREGRRFAVATERLMAVRALETEPQLVPALEPLPGDAPMDREAAVLLAVRGWMEICGPITAPELSQRLLLPASEVNQALYALEREGVVLRGTFRPMPPDAKAEAEWCDRRLLQRIHRLTVGKLRKEIEPLTGQDFMRFLFRWHHMDDQLRGTGGLLKAISLLQGYEAPAAAWELLLLPARMKYIPELLERACYAGEVAWGRLTPRDAKPTVQPGPRRGTNPVAFEPRSPRASERSDRVEGPALGFPQTTVSPPFTPTAGPQARNGGALGSITVSPYSGRTAVPQLRSDLLDTTESPAPAAPRRASPNRNASLAFVRREELDWMLAAARPDASTGTLNLPADLSHAARDVVAALERRGACFFQDLVSASRRLPTEVEDALWELLAHGLVTGDALENLRVLQSPKKRKRQKLLRRGGPGRWSLLRPLDPRPREELIEKTARLFLTRYGIVFRDLVLREPLSPSWRELLRVYRRMEARGEIRGGRFLAGFAGEQFALPEAVDMARQVRRDQKQGERIHISAVDPLNLTGLVTPGPRVPATVGNFVTYMDGVPVGNEPPPPRNVELLDESEAEAVEDDDDEDSPAEEELPETAQ